MILDASDTTVLARLRADGPGTVTVRQLAADTGLRKMTVRVAVACLASEGLVCVIPDHEENAYLVRHLHAGPGECEEPLGRAIQEVHPDGQ